MKILPHLLLLLFFIIRYPFQSLLYQFSDYGTYIFESLFIILVIMIFRDSRGQLSRPDIKKVGSIFLMLGFGLAVSGNMPILGVFLPWELSATSDLLMLLIFAPILEELLYRQALWILIEKRLKSKWGVVVLTSILFSLGHFYPYFAVDPIFKPFVLYQTSYTLLVGLFCGLIYMRGKDILGSIVAHLVFNWGFYLGYLLWGKGF